MWAGTVVAPPGATSAAIDSVTSRSRSVGLNASLARSARTSTLARIGIVLRRSTTRWTCPSDLSSSARSTVTFISHPAPGEFQPCEGSGKVALGSGFRKGARRQGRAFQPIRYAVTLGGAQAGRGTGIISFLQLPLQELDLLRQRGVAVHQVLDLAHRVQYGGVVAASEAPPDLGQRPQRQRLGQKHGDLARPHDIGGAPRREQISAAHIVLAGDDALDVLDLYALGRHGSR